jgi:hypothetical protein
MAEGSSNRITITVKTPKDKKDVEVDEDSSVEKVKSKSSLRFLI